VDESGRDNVTPVSDAIDRSMVAEEEMMDMTATKPY